MGYAAPDVLPVDTLEEGTSLLISGPPLTRKRDLLIELLAAGQPDDGTVMITTKLGAGKLLQRYRETAGEEGSDRLRVIDCVTRERALGPVRDTETTSYVSSPRDMTGLSIEITGVFRRFHEMDVPTRFGFHSLSTILMYHDLQRTYRMVHILTGQIESADWIGGFVLDSPTDRERSMLSQLVDGIVETRETDEGCELRLRGVPGADRGWHPY